MDIEIYGLRIFYEVMTQKSFSAAARALKLTQPTVSQQIAKIESEMGHKLFERVGHDIIPTQAPQHAELANEPPDHLNLSLPKLINMSRSDACPHGTFRLALCSHCTETRTEA